jgi:hypothetical protein
MRFHQIALVCECGCAAENVRAVGFTSEYELVIHWTCADCGKLAYLVKSLADCCKQCPEAEENSAVEDARFLESLGIRP